MYAKEDVDRLRGVSTAAISDALDTMSRRQLVIPPPIRLLAGRRMFGPAVTVMMAPTGEKAHPNAAMQVLDECEPGSVLVLAGEPDPVASVFGAAEIAIATARGFGGLLTDCMVRPRLPLNGDVVGVAGSGLSPASAFGRLKTLALSRSSVCSGVTIDSGDLVVGDELGIVIVPTKYVAAVAEVAARYEARIEKIQTDAVEGRSIREAVKRHWSVS